VDSGTGRATAITRLSLTKAAIDAGSV
jgi:hypothetical protein